MDPLLKILMENEELDYVDDVIDYPDRLPEVTVCEKTVTPVTVTDAEAAKESLFDERTQQLQRIADEIARIQAMQKAEVERYGYKENRSPRSDEDANARSVYVKGVDYSASRNRLEDHFSKCGPVVRITILTDNATGRSRGAAYIEFESADAVQNALQLNGSVFCGRKLMVVPKRTNKPGFNPSKPSTYGERRSFNAYGGGYRQQHHRRYTPY